MSKYHAQVKIFLLISLTLLSSCAANKFIVSNADTLLEHQITKRLPLNSAQKTVLDRDVNQFLNTQKARAKKLRNLVEAVKLDEPQAITAHYREIVAHYEEVIQDFSIMISDHLVNLDNKQQKEFIEKISQETKQLIKKEPKERVKKVTERFKTFFGSVSEEQKKYLHELQDHFESRNKLRIERRKTLKSEISKIYNQKIPASDKKDLLVQVFKTFNKLSLDHKKNQELIVIFHPTISKDQKNHLLKKLDEVKDILTYFIDAKY